MENIESPNQGNLLSRPIERNALKELNGIEVTATKLPKDNALADQTVIIINNCFTDDSDEAAVNKILLRSTAPADVECSDNGYAQSPSKKMLQFGDKCNNLNETCTVPYANLQDATFVSTNSANSSDLYDKIKAKESSEVCTPPGLNDATFVSSKAVYNRTVVLETGSLEYYDKMESKEGVADSQLNQTQANSESHTNQSINADGETRQFSLDSPKQLNQDEPTTPTGKRIPAVSAEKLFSSRKAPTFSEMFSSISPTTNELNGVATNKQWDASFVVDRTYVTREKCPNATVVLGGEKMPMEVNSNGDAFDFKEPEVPIAGKSNKQNEDVDNFMVLNSNDFDFLQSRGANSVDPENDPRSSLLLRFDPLTNRHSLHPTQSTESVLIAEGHNDTPITAAGPSNQTISYADHHSTNQPPSNGFVVQVAMESDSNGCINNVRIEKNGDKVISVDELLLTNKKIDTTSVDENIRKKMEEYEATQEILLKRITEKDKAITKASNVLELYEKAISEALAAKEKLSQNYDKEHEELKTDRDVTFQHLLSLESTFADLHMKFERNVQYTGQLQEKLNAITDDKSKAEDLLRQQEFRYDKMKGHTMQQFDIANAKLEQQTRTISLENTKLRAQIKREEIHKNAVAEELSQKKKENEELVKICDELISGQRN